MLVTLVSGLCSVVLYLMLGEKILCQYLPADRWALLQLLRLVCFAVTMMSYFGLYRGDIVWVVDLCHFFLLLIGNKCAD